MQHSSERDEVMFRYSKVDWLPTFKIPILQMVAPLADVPRVFEDTLQALLQEPSACPRSKYGEFQVLVKGCTSANPTFLDNFGSKTKWWSSITMEAVLKVVQEHARRRGLASAVVDGRFATTSEGALPKNGHCVGRIIGRAHGLSRRPEDTNTLACSWQRLVFYQL